MNLFDKILNTAKTGFNAIQPSYLSSGQFGSDIFDIQQQAQQKQSNPIQSFLDESKDKPDMQSKRTAVIQMIQNGENDAFIQDTIVNKMGYNPSLTLKERVGSSLGQRFATAGESLQTDKTGFEKAISAGKDVLMSPFDVIGGAIQPVVQPVMEQAMKIPGVAPTTQFIGEQYGQFRESNPRLAQNIEAVTGIGSVVAPFTKTGQAVAQVPGKLVKQGAKATMQGIKNVAPSVVKGAEATVDVATAPFKSIYNTARKYVATPEEISGIQSAIKPKQKIKNGVVQRSQKQIEDEIKLTNALIRGKGKLPQDLDTYAQSQKDLLTEMGSEIEKATGQPLYLDSTPTAGKIRQLANSKAIQTLDPADTNALLALADRLEQNGGRLSIADAETMNQYINDVLRSTNATASEGYKKGLLTLVQDLREGLDTTISNIPGEFKNLKKAYGAVRNVYGDTVARQIVFNRQNMTGLVDSMSAIEGFGNIASGAGKIVTGNVKEGFVDIGKGMTQNAVGRFIKGKNDPNNIIRAIFKQGGERAKGPDIKPKPLPMLPAPSGKASGAKNVRVNQPMEKSPIVNEGQKGTRPITPQKKEAQKLLSAPRIPAGTSLPRTDIVAESMQGATKAKRPVTPTPIKEVTPKKITPTEKVETKKVETVKKDVKYTPEQRISVMEKGEYDKSFYDKIVKEGKTTDDLLSSEFRFGPEDKYVLKNNAVDKRYNELLKQENNDKITTLQKQIENTKDIKPGSLDNRIKRETETYNFHNENAKSDTGLAKEYEQIQVEYYKKKIELLQKANGGVTPKDPTKTTVNLTKSKGGFIRLPEIGKKIPVKNPLVEEARKYKSAEEFEKALRSPRGIGYGGNMGILWRATSKPFKPNTKTIIEHGITDSGDTKSYAKDILLSNDYGKSEPYLISKDAKIASWREGNDVYKVTKESAFSKKSVEEFKRRGFDGFERGPDEIVIFNENKIKPFNINDFFTNYIK